MKTHLKTLIRTLFKHSEWSNSWKVQRGQYKCVSLGRLSQPYLNGNSLPSIIRALRAVLLFCLFYQKKHSSKLTNWSSKCSSSSNKWSHQAIIDTKHFVWFSLSKFSLLISKYKCNIGNKDLYFQFFCVWKKIAFPCVIWRWV